MTPLDMVREFKVRMGQDKDPDRAAKMVHEEYDEWLEESTWDGAKSYKPDKELKELADMVYVIYGRAYDKGWDLDEAVKRVHSNNLERCIWPDGSIKRREDGKILKNPKAKKIYLKDMV